MSEEEMDESWQWIDPDGTRLMKTPAAIALLETLCFTRPVARAIRFARLSWLVGLGNGFFSRIRTRAGKLVPDVEPIVRWP